MVFTNKSSISLIKTQYLGNNMKGKDRSTSDKVICKQFNMKMKSNTGFSSETIRD